MVYTIGEMAKMLGVPASTLRYYDKEDRVDKGINDLPLVFHVSHVTLAKFFKPEPHPFAGQDGLF